MACLSYQPSLIKYQNHKFKVTDMHKLKGKILTQCLRLLRDAINGESFDGQNMQNFEDERAYIIEPLLKLQQ